jgi:ribosomal protein S27E
MQPYLNPITMEVHCSECDAPISNIPVFTKNLMKSQNQVKKSAKVAFGVKCAKCKADALPKVDANNKLVCVSCGNALNISKIYENQIREIIKNGGHKDL